MHLFNCIISRYSVNLLDLDNDVDMETILSIPSTAQNTETVEGIVTTTAAQVTQSIEGQEAIQSTTGQVSLQSAEAQASTKRNKNCKSSVFSTLSLLLSLTGLMLFVLGFQHDHVDVRKLTMPDYFGSLTEKITKGEPLDKDELNKLVRSLSYPIEKLTLKPHPNVLRYMVNKFLDKFSYMATNNIAVSCHYSGL